MYKLDVDLEKRIRQIEEMFDAGLMSPSIFLDMVQDIRNEEQVGVVEYNFTDDEIDEYWN